MIEYGSVNRHQQYANGKLIQDKLVYTQSVRIQSDDDVIEIMRALLEQRSRGDVHNPSISLEEYADTGKLKRLIKQWSVYE